MLSKNLENPIVAVSVRVYQALLVAYPTKFQQEYGSHMLQVFRDSCLRTFHQSGTNGMARLWAVTLFDLIQSLVSEHTQKETFMTRSKFVRLSGWALMLGGITFILFFLGIYIEENVYDPLRRFQAFSQFSFLITVWVTPILFSVGLLGLRTRYGDEVGSLGKNILLFGAIAGPATTIIGFTITATVEWGWTLLFAGDAVLLGCLAIFGVLALNVKPLPRWNGLPLIAGLWFPILMPASLIANANGISDALITSLSTLLMPLQCIALVMLGYVLQSDTPEETVTA